MSKMEEGDDKAVFTIWVQPKKDLNSSRKSINLHDSEDNNNNTKRENYKEPCHNINKHLIANSRVNTNSNGKTNFHKSASYPKASLLKYEIRHLTNLKKIETEHHKFVSKENKENRVGNTLLRTSSEAESEQQENDMNDNVRTSRYGRQSDTFLTDRIRSNRVSRLTSDEYSTDRVRPSRASRIILDNDTVLERARRVRTRTASEEGTERSRSYRASRAKSDLSSMSKNDDCVDCIVKQMKIAELESELKTAKENLGDSKKLKELEEQLENSLKEKEDFSTEIQKLQKEIKKINKNLDEEKVQTRRLGIKLEDANYEIGRLRQELISSQLENEKIVEENEDLAVDNEDLIKERDEIIQIYDELFRESERLKHEVKIWKTVFENNRGDLPEVDVNEDDEEEDKKKNEESEEEDHFELEEDQSLLIPPRHDIKVKATDVSRAFEQSDEIARGKFGKVYKMVARTTGDTYAAKYIKVTPKLREDVLNTIDVMKKIHHVRLMNIFDVYDLGSQIVMLLEYIGGGMLFERIIERNSLTEADCALYIKQILQGLHHLHLQHIVHLELRPENILCVNRKSMDIKIIDFGLAKQLDAKKEIKITAGSPEFVAPEILSFDPVSLNSDLWSVGVLTYVLLSGISPFNGDDDNDTLMNVSCGEFEYDDKLFMNITSDAKSFINKLLVSNPKKRPNVSRCLQHPWITSNWQAKQNAINLGNMKKFLEKRKEKGNASAVRAVRRFSSFGVSHCLMKPGGGLQRTSSKHLLVPNALQASVIAEDEEEEKDENENIKNINKSMLNGPTLTITKDCSSEVSRPTSGDFDDSGIPENTDTPDGLRSYLERMINSGMLPGRNGAPDISEAASDDER